MHVCLYDVNVVVIIFVNTLYHLCFLMLHASMIVRCECCSSSICEYYYNICATWCYMQVWLYDVNVVVLIFVNILYHLCYLMLHASMIVRCECSSSSICEYYYTICATWCYMHVWLYDVNVVVLIFVNTLYHLCYLMLHASMIVRCECCSSSICEYYYTICATWCYMQVWLYDVNVVVLIFVNTLYHLCYLMLHASMIVRCECSSSHICKYLIPSVLLDVTCKYDCMMWM